jgi:hypothetical protein
MVSYVPHASPGTSSGRQDDEPNGIIRLQALMLRHGIETVGKIGRLA